MVPADDAILGILFVFDLVDMFPSVLGKCDVGAGLLCIFAWNACLNLNPPGTVLSNQHSADFRLDRGARVLANLAHNFTLNYESGLAGS